MTTVYDPDRDVLETGGLRGIAMANDVFEERTSGDLERYVDEFYAKKPEQRKKRQGNISYEVYRGFYVGGSEFSENYAADLEGKRSLLLHYFPERKSSINKVNGLDLGAMFNGFMRYARDVVFEGITGEDLRYLTEIALMPFPSTQKGEEISAREIKARLSRLRKLGYPVRKGVGKMKRNDAQDYLELIRNHLKLELSREDSRALNEIREENRKILEREYNLG